MERSMTHLKIRNRGVGQIPGVYKVLLSNEIYEACYEYTILWGVDLLCGLIRELE